MAATPWSLRDGSIVLTVRLTPKASRDEIEGIAELADGTAVLKARVRAIPEAGKANAALIKLLSKTLGISESRIDLRSGAAGRTKILELTGDSQALATRLTALTAKL